jgi:DNA-binding transcriptional ArsR family regulator
VESIIQALADPIRREILRMVRDAPLPAGAIAGAFAVSRPAVSRHLRVLREAGLVREKTLGRERLYRLEPAPLERVEAMVAELRISREAEQAAWERRFMSLETEVHRTRRRSRAARATPSETRKKATA